MNEKSLAHDINFSKTKNGNNRTLGINIYIGISIYIINIITENKVINNRIKRRKIRAIALYLTGCLTATSLNVLIAANRRDGFADERKS